MSRLVNSYPGLIRLVSDGLVHSPVLAGEQQQQQVNSSRPGTVVRHGRPKALQYEAARDGLDRSQV